MNAAEIVVREVGRDGGSQVRQLFAEGIGDPRKSPHRHSHGEVLRSTNEVLVCSGSGSPCRTLDITPEMRAGESLAS
jgi:hypothetical protein